jgi:gliding motility-associatede transport system auxiliary component
VRKSSGLLGLVGIILLLFAGVTFALTRGNNPVDVVYISVHAVAGVLALIAYFSSGIDNVRSFLGERSTKYGTSTALASLFFIGILIGLNYLSTRYHHRWDLTEASVFSLSPQSTSVVKDLKKPLKMLAFVEGGVNPDLKDLLDSYHYASSEVSYEMIDPDRQPELAEKYNITAYNTVRLEYGKDGKEGGESTATVTQPSEETITNAIIKVSRTSKQTACVIEGHGEPDIEDKESARGLSSVKTALTDENYEVKKILLASLPDVPPECNVVIVAGPTRPYLEHELQALDKYLHGGGRALFLLAPQRAEEFRAFLEPWGVKLGDDVVVDQVVRLFQGPALGLEPLVDTYDKTHEITRELKGRTLFPMVRSVSADTAGKPGLTATEIVKTSPSSWAETDLTALFQHKQAALEDSDRKGPVPIAVAVDADLKKMGVAGDKTARLVVFGSSEFADNQHLGGTYFNRDLFLNAVGWLVGQSDLLSIRPRSMRASRVNFNQEEGTIIFYLSVLVLPELLLITGLAVWWRRE